MIEQLTGERQCAKCRDCQPVSEFSMIRRASGKLYPHSYCKRCRREDSNRKTAACERADYTPKREPRESPTAWLLPRDPRPFMQKLIAATQHKHRKAYPVEPAANLTWRLAA